MIFSDRNFDIGSGTLATHIQHATFDNKNLLYLRIWEHVLSAGRWRSHDYQVKTEPDTMFIPDRLRANMGSNIHATNFATFWANCDDPDGNKKLHGALEVYSWSATKRFMDNLVQCTDHSGHPKWAEDFMMQCMQLLNVNFNTVSYDDLLHDPECDPRVDAVDCSATAVAFHAMDTVEHWEACFNEAHHGEE